MKQTVGLLQKKKIVVHGRIKWIDKLIKAWEGDVGLGYGQRRAARTEYLRWNHSISGVCFPGRLSAATWPKF